MAKISKRVVGGTMRVNVSIPRRLMARLGKRGARPVNLSALITAALTEALDMGASVSESRPAPVADCRP